MSIIRRAILSTLATAALLASLACSDSPARLGAEPAVSPPAPAAASAARQALAASNTTNANASFLKARPS